MPPAERERWLQTQEGIIALGAKTCADIAKGLRLQQTREQNSLASGAWIDACWNERTIPPFENATHQGGGFNWRGIWRFTATYYPNDAIRLHGHNYRAVVKCAGVRPGTDPKAWQPTACRGNAVRMMLGRGLVRFGEEGLPRRRWTPPNAVAIEDFLDCMGNLAAEFYNHPPSPSAVAIRCSIALGKQNADRMGRSNRIPKWLAR